MLSFLYISAFFCGCASQEVYNKVLELPLSTFTGPNKFRYACSAYPIKADEYIVDFQPDKDNDVHHIALNTCEEPYEDAKIWDCFDPSHICKKGSKKEALFAWTKGAPGWRLPYYAGFFTGNKSKYIVLQVHGRPHGPNNKPGHYARMHVTFQIERPQLDAALGIYAVDGYIPANTVGFTTDVACTWELDIRVPLIGYKLHTHDYGKVVSGYIIRNGTWIEIGRGDPRYPLVLYDLSHRDMFLEPGDIVAARCTYDNHENRIIHMGFGSRNEMCNLILHYGIPHDFPTKTTSCVTNAQDFHWEDRYEDIPALAGDASGDTDQRFYIKKYHLVKNIMH